MLAILREGVDCAGPGERPRGRGALARPGLGRPSPDALEPFRADVSLMAHVGYDIEDVGPFLDALEAVTRRLCIAVMGEGAMTTVGRLYWERIHGEPRVPLPALPDLVTLLLARGRLPEVRLVDREPPTHEHLEGLHDRARRQLWLRPGLGPGCPAGRAPRQRCRRARRRGRRCPRTGHASASSPGSRARGSRPGPGHRRTGTR